MKKEMNRMERYVLKDGFLDLGMNEHIINHRRQYKKEYGVINKENGVEFYFDLELVV